MRQPLIGLNCVGRRSFGRRLAISSRARPAHHVLQQDRIGDRARQRAGVAIGVEIERRIVGIAAIGRLVADEPASRRPGCGSSRRCPSRWRSADVPEARLAAEPPDEPPGVNFGFHGLRVTPQSLVVGTDGAGEFRRRGARMHDAAGLQDALVVRRGDVRHEVLVDQRAVGGRLALDPALVLDARPAGLRARRRARPWRISPRPCARPPAPRRNG